MNMRRGDIRTYAILAVIVLTVIIIYKFSRPKKVDYRPSASGKLQLSSSVSKPSSCVKEDKSVVSGKTVSVVISTQANEEAVITQTVNSIIAHSDPNVLLEIIIAVDSKVSDDHLTLLNHEFEEYKDLVTIMQGKSDIRIKNKLVMGHTAKGDIILFIDDSVVVTANYLSPLIEVLQEHPERIAVPSYDFLTDLTVSVESTGSQMKWTFGWRLNIQPYEMTFQQLASKTETAASKAVVFDTSAFALNKGYMAKLGSLKSEMEYTGSLELSFAAWLCGDGAYVVPCSRVAKIHVDRAIEMENEKERHMLAARYFTPKYQRIFNRVNKDAPQWTEQDKTAMAVDKSLQKKCPKNFDWYMEEIAKSDVFVPSDNAIAYGHFVSSSGKTCFKQAPSRNFLGTHDCKNQQNGGMVEYLKSGQLRIGRDCIYGNDQSYMLSDPCDYEKDYMKWNTSEYHQFIDSMGQCISHATDPYAGQNGRQVLMFTKCSNDPKNAQLKWQGWKSFIWL